MKQSFFLVAFFFTLVVNGQTPQAFKFQAIARDNNGSLLTDQLLGVRIGIIDSSAGGSTVYEEVHQVETNQYGLFSLNIGEGVSTIAPFKNIPWITGNKWIKIELDHTGQNIYTTMGMQPLLSVPYALYSGSSNQNSYLKNNGLYISSADPAQATGSENVILNPELSASITTASHVTAVGAGAGASITVEGDGTFVGYRAGNKLRANSHGNCCGNVAMGSQAFAQADSNAYDNTVIGSSAGTYSPGGTSANVFIGNSTCEYCAGGFNTVVGYKALQNSKTTNSTVAIGWDAGMGDRAGQSNTYLGAWAGTSQDSIVGSIALGFYATANASHQFIVGSDQDFFGDINMIGLGYSTTGKNIPMIYGERRDSTSIFIGLGTVTPEANLDVAGSIKSDSIQVEILKTGSLIDISANAAGQLIPTPSDKILKKEIQPINPNEALATILSLQGVSYAWKDDVAFGTGRTLGFIAQDVESILPEAVTQTTNYKSVNYKLIIPMLVEAMKEQQQQIEALKKEIRLLTN